MHFSSYLCEIYIHIISVLFVCCQEFSHQIHPNHQNTYNRRIIRPNSERSPKHVFPQQNAMFAGRAHPRPNTIGFQDTTQRPQESRLPSRESTSHVRQQMPYQSNDPNVRSTNSRQQLISNISPKRQDSNEMPFHLPPKYMQNSNPFHSRPKYPQIIANPKHLRIQSPHEREEEYDDVLQNVEQNNFRDRRNNQRGGMGSHNFGFIDNNNIRDDSRQQFSPSFNERPFEPSGRPPNFFPSPSAGQVDMKVVVPRHRDKEETRVHGFETFSSKHDLQEFDKIYPESERTSNHKFHSFNDIPPEEPTEDYGNVPENEARLQRDLNLFPPVDAEEEIRRFNEPFKRPPPHKQHSKREEIPDYFGNQFRKSVPNSYYSAPNQQNQNKANHQNIEGFEQSIQHSPPHSPPHIPQHNPSYNSINGGPNVQTFFGDNNPNGFDFRRTNVNKDKNRFQQFYGNDFQRQTTQKPNQMHKTYGRPVKKAIEIVREITEIVPDDDHSNNHEDHFDPSSIATPSPPDPPNDFFPFTQERREEEEENPKKKTGLDSAKEENFYDDDEERQLLEHKNKDTDIDEDEPEKRNPKSKFEKEVDMSSDDLERYFDREFANENLAEEDAQKKIEFDDESKESSQLVAEKKPEDNEDEDVEADYKSSTDFLKNHDNFLTKIEKENDKFRKRTEDKVEKEEEDETETEQKPVVDDGEKELDGVDTEKKEGEEVSDDNNKNDQNIIKEDKGVTEEEQSIDANEETKDKKETEVEDDEESETKEVTEKQDQKSSDNSEDNQQNEEKNEEQEDDNGVKDEEKSDNTENDESNDANDEKETKTEKCLENNCDKELLKEESKESKINTQQLKSKDTETEEPVVEQKPSKESSRLSIEIKPIESKPNTSLRVLSKHNFAPFFIDLKRINPNKSNIRNGSQNNERPNSRTTSATTSPVSGSSPKHNSSAKSVSPPLESSDANKTKPTDNNKTIETRRVVNSIKDIIKSQNRR